MRKCYIVFEVKENENIPFLVALDKDSAIEEWEKLIDSGKKSIIKPIKCVGEFRERIR